MLVAAPGEQGMTKYSHDCVRRSLRLDGVTPDGLAGTAAVGFHYIRAIMLSLQSAYTLPHLRGALAQGSATQ